MFQFGKKNKNLEELLLRLHANASNNYKAVSYTHLTLPTIA